MSIELILQVVLAFLGAYLFAFWFALVVWTFRDIRARTHDIFLQVLATSIVLLFNLPGLLLYFLLRPRETLAEVYERTLEEETLLQEIEDFHACPHCRQRVELDYQVCPACRTRLRNPCDRCGRLMHLSWRLCPFCTNEPAPEREPLAPLRVRETRPLPDAREREVRDRDTREREPATIR